MNPFTRYRCAPLASAIEAGLSQQPHRGMRASGVASLAMAAALGWASTNAVADGNTYFVTTNADSGQGSLRGAIALANAASGNTIEFAANLSGSTITLTTGQISIGKPMTIAGPGAQQLTISGNNQSRIFYVQTYLSHSPVTISGVTLTAGAASGVEAGGAIYARNAYLSVKNSTVSGSTAFVGGGIYSNGESVDTYLSIQDSTLAANYATLSGGGLFARHSNVSLFRATIADNTAATSGGGIYAGTSSEIAIYSSTISGNSLRLQSGGSYTPRGGGIALNSIAGGVSIVNSTIANNYAASGGAGVVMFDQSASAFLYLIAVTVAGNRSSAGATGIGITTNANASNGLVSCIVANNADSANAQNDLAGSFFAASNLIGSLGSGVLGSGSNGNLIGADPMLSRLADHGGSTLTMLPEPTSLAIDHGYSSLSGPLDQRGYARVVLGVADIGAVERHYPEDIIFRNGFDLP